VISSYSAAQIVGPLLAGLLHPPAQTAARMRSVWPAGEMDQRSKLVFDAGSTILVQAGPSIHDRCTLDER
jgi:hypothetical protein